MVSYHVLNMVSLTKRNYVPEQAVFARGISAVWENFICVGKYRNTDNSSTYILKSKKW